MPRDEALSTVYARRLNRYREDIKDLEAERDAECLTIWVNPSAQPLIQGLPDQIVDNVIWPKIRTFMEEPTPGTRGGDPETNVERIDLLKALSQSSRKWRHLVLHSKPWGGLRCVMENFCPRYWKYRKSIVIVDYCFYVKMLPPVDILGKQNIRKLLHWGRAWTFSFDKEERETYIGHLKDTTDSSNRLTRWKK